MTKQKNAFSTKNLVLISLFCAIAYITVLLFRIPVVSILKYEPKNVIITLAGLIIGPISTVFISLIVSFIEMVTISDNGIYGMFMNVVATLSFTLPVAIIYKYRKSISSAVIGLSIGTVLMTLMMLLWNYIVSPYYFKTPRSVVVDMLIPVFLPFNILKGVLNSTLVFLVYKPVISALRSSNLIPQGNENLNISKKQIIIFNSCAIAILAICIVVWIIWRIDQK